MSVPYSLTGHSRTRETNESSGMREWPPDRQLTFVRNGERLRGLLHDASESHLAGSLILRRASGGCGSEHPTAAPFVVCIGYCENFHPKNSSTSSDTSFVRNAPPWEQRFRPLSRRCATENQNTDRRSSRQVL